jgi:hypothetical protein
MDTVAVKEVWNPEYRWSNLTWRQRREVSRRARHRERHPDPQIARIADAWADEVLRPRDRPRRLGGALAVVALALVGEGDLAGGWLGMGIARRRLAKRIVRARRLMDESTT